MLRPAGWDGQAGLKHFFMKGSKDQLPYRAEYIGEDPGELVLIYPLSPRYVFLNLWGGCFGGGCGHKKPAGFLQGPGIFFQGECVECAGQGGNDAEPVYSAFFLHFAQGGFFRRFSVIGMAFGEVPLALAEDKKELPFLIGDQAAHSFPWDKKRSHVAEEPKGVR